MLLLSLAPHKSKAIELQLAEAVTHGNRRETKLVKRLLPCSSDCHLANAGVSMRKLQGLAKPCTKACATWEELLTLQS